ncbi:hypothetical protein [Thermogemmatispora sp.]|uniref:hypothetical protein n=1 Tax=Thermogemmatispora sp. TaxID=1968838 RepID=UPI0035E421FC
MHIDQPARGAGWLVVSVLRLTALVVSGPLSLASQRTRPRPPASSLSTGPGRALPYQAIDGFGLSGAFGSAQEPEQLPSSLQRQILDLLFS